MNRYGLVYYKNLLCGKIEETDEGYIFTYDINYLNHEDAKSISLTLPLSNEPYFSNIIHPFFDGLIPEGWLLSLAVKKWNLSTNDRMGLLLTVCEDTIGAVSVKGVIR